VQNDPAELIDLASVRSEFEAATMVEALRAQGIAAQHYGGGLAGFRAEAPGFVRVVVRRQDADRARLALRALQADSIDIDWDEVDVGEPEEPVRESLPDASGYKCSRCGYRVDHVPADKPCPECGAKVQGGVAHLNAPSHLRGHAAKRRERLKALMGEIALGMAALFAAWLLALPLIVWLSIGVATLVLMGWTVWVFLRAGQPAAGPEDARGTGWSEK
jgi:hypothetical protein